MGNVESNSSTIQTFPEVQRIQEVLNMDTELYHAQRGGLHVGQRVVEADSGIHGRIIEIHDRYSFTNAKMMGDNGKIYEHHISHFQDEEKIWTNHRYTVGLPVAPATRSALIAKFNIGQRVFVTGKIGFLKPMGDYKEVYDKVGTVTYVETTAPIGKVIYNINFDDQTIGGEVWEEYISLAPTRPALVFQTASPPLVAPRTGPSKAASPPLVAPRTGPSKAASPFDPYAYCASINSGLGGMSQMPEMTADDIHKQLCAALMK
jgi:hypothetical protein